MTFILLLIAVLSALLLLGATMALSQLLSGAVARLTVSEPARPDAAIEQLLTVNAAEPRLPRERRQSQRLPLP